MARDNLFSSEINPDDRAEIWSRQRGVSERLVDEYAWATPDNRAVRIIRYFSPIIEIGCGKNWYWAKLLRSVGVGILAYDNDIVRGCKILSSSFNR